MLVVGGGGDGSTLNSTELYDPSTGVWNMIGSMNYARTYHITFVLLNGKVLVVGGSNDAASLNSAEVYDPSAGMWTIAANMNHA